MPPPSVAAFPGRMGDSDESTGARDASSADEGQLHSVCSVLDGDGRASGARKSATLIAAVGDTSAARSGIFSKHNGGQTAEAVSDTSSSRGGPTCGAVVEGGRATDSSGRKSGSGDACHVTSNSFRGGKSEVGVSALHNSHRSCGGNGKQAAQSPHPGKHGGAMSGGQSYAKGHSASSSSHSSKSSANHQSGERHSHSTSKQTSTYSGRDTQANVKSSSSSSSSSGKKVACGFDSELSARELRKIKYYEEMFARLANEERQKQSGMGNVPGSNPSASSGAGTSPGNYHTGEKGPRKHPSHARLTGEGGSGPGKLPVGPKPADAGDSRESQPGPQSSAASASSGAPVQAAALAVGSTRNSVGSSGSKRKHSRVIDSTDDEGPPPSPARLSTVKRVPTGKATANHNSVPEHAGTAVTSNPLHSASGASSDGAQRGSDKVIGRQSGGEAGGGGSRGEPVLGGGAQRQSQHIEGRAAGSGNSSLSASRHHPHSCGARTKSSSHPSGLRSVKGGGEGVDHVVPKGGEGGRKKRRLTTISPSAEAANSSSSSSSSSSSGTSSSDSSDSESGSSSGGVVTNNRCLSKGLQRGSAPLSRSGASLAGSAKRLAPVSKKRFYSGPTNSSSAGNGGATSAPGIEDSRRVGEDDSSSSSNGSVHSSSTVKNGGERRDVGATIVGVAHHSALEGGLRKAPAGGGNAALAGHRTSSAPGGGGISASASRSSASSSVSATVANVKSVVSCSQRASTESGGSRSCSAGPGAEGSPSGTSPHQTKNFRGRESGENSDSGCGKGSDKEKGFARTWTSVDTASSLRTKHSSANRSCGTAKPATLNLTNGGSGGALQPVELTARTDSTAGIAEVKSLIKENPDFATTSAKSSSTGSSQLVSGGVKQEKTASPRGSADDAAPPEQRCKKESVAEVAGDGESYSRSGGPRQMVSSSLSPSSSSHQSSGRSTTGTTPLSPDASQATPQSVGTAACPVRKVSGGAEKESCSSPRTYSGSRRTSSGLVKGTGSQEIAGAADSESPGVSSSHPSVEEESREREGSPRVEHGSPPTTEADAKSEELSGSYRQGDESEERPRTGGGSENSFGKSRVLLGAADSTAADKPRLFPRSSEGLPKTTGKSVTPAACVPSVSGVSDPSKGCPALGGSSVRPCGTIGDRQLSSASNSTGSAPGEYDGSEMVLRGPTTALLKGEEAGRAVGGTESKAESLVTATGSRSGGSASAAVQGEHESESGGHAAAVVEKPPAALLASDALDAVSAASLEKGPVRKSSSESERRSSVAHTPPEAPSWIAASCEDCRSSASNEDQREEGQVARLEGLGSSGGTAGSGGSHVFTSDAESRLSGEAVSPSSADAHQQVPSQAAGGGCTKNDHPSLSSAATVAEASVSEELSPRGADSLVVEWGVEAQCSAHGSTNARCPHDRNQALDFEKAEEGEQPVSYAPAPLLAVARAVSAQPLTNTPLPSGIAGRKGGGRPHAMARQRNVPVSQPTHAGGLSHGRGGAANGDAACRCGASKVSARHSQRAPDSPVLTDVVCKESWVDVITGEQGSRAVGCDCRQGVSASAQPRNSLVFSAVLPSDSLGSEQRKQKEEERKSGLQKSAAPEASGVVLLTNGASPRHSPADSTAGVLLDSQGYAEACCSVVPVRDWRRLLLGGERANWDGASAGDGRCGPVGEGGTKQARNGSVLSPAVSQPCSGADGMKKLPRDCRVGSASPAGKEGFTVCGATSEKRPKGVGLLASVSKKPAEQDTLGGGTVKRTAAAPEPLVLNGRWLTSLSWKAQLLRKVYNSGRPVR